MYVEDENLTTKDADQIFNQSIWEEKNETRNICD